MNKKEFRVHQADQQLTGFIEAKRGTNLIQLIESMGLELFEWKILKKGHNVKSYMNEDEIDEINNHFKVHGIKDDLIGYCKEFING